MLCVASFSPEAAKSATLHHEHEKNSKCPCVCESACLFSRPTQSVGMQKGEVGINNSVREQQHTTQCGLRAAKARLLASIFPTAEEEERSFFNAQKKMGGRAYVFLPPSSREESCQTHTHTIKCVCTQTQHKVLAWPRTGTHSSYLLRVRRRREEHQQQQQRQRRQFQASLSALCMMMMTGFLSKMQRASHEEDDGKGGRRTKGRKEA